MDSFMLRCLTAKRGGSSLSADLTRVRRSDSSSLATAIQSVQQVSNWTLDSMEVTSSEDEFGEVCMSFFFVLDFSHQYYIPTIICIGLIGNLLSCVVFLNTHLKMRSSSYYLAALAMTDFSFLFSLLLVWLNNTIGWRVFNIDGWCETVVYVSSVCSSLSVWLIVAFTVERFIAVQYPLHRPHMCTITRAKTIVIVLVVLAMASHSYSFVTAGVVKQQDGSDMCEMKVEYFETMRIVSIIDSIASLMAPLILIIVMNTMIMRNLFNFSQSFGQAPGPGFSEARCPSREPSDINLNPIPSASSSGNGIPLSSGIAGRRYPSQQSFQSSKNSHSHSRSGGTQQSQANAPPSVIAAPSTPRTVYNIAVNSSRCIHVRSSSRNLVSTRNQQSITKMLLLISSVFIILNIPSYIIRLCIFFFTLTRQDTPALLWCLQQFFMLLYYTNFSINFLLYAMCGITFRRCLWQLLRKVLKKISKYHCNPQRYM